MLWGYGRYKYFNSFSAGIDFRRQNLTSRGQILTYKDGPRTERVEQIIQSVYFSYQEIFFVMYYSVKLIRKHKG